MDNATPAPSAAQVLAELPLGKIEHEDIKAYHAAPAISVSKMKVFRQSPALYHGRFVTKRIPRPEPTPALLFGSAAGVLILEGRVVFDAQYYVVPAGVGRQKKRDKMLRKSLAAENPGKLELSFDDMVALEKMLAKVQAHRFAGPLIEACKPEITWRIKGESFHLQVRTDGWSEEGCALTQGYPFILDLKTLPAMPDDEPETVSRQVAEFWYHGQAWTYREVVSAISKFSPEFRPRFFFVFVEKEEPYGVQVVELDDQALDLADKQARETLERLKWCHARNIWPDTWLDTWQQKPPVIGLPPYYIRRSVDSDGNNLWN